MGRVQELLDPHSSTLHRFHDYPQLLVSTKTSSCHPFGVSAPARYHQPDHNPTFVFCTLAPPHLIDSTPSSGPRRSPLELSIPQSL